MSSFTLTDSLFSTPRMRSVFSDQACLQRMLDVEAALARAQASIGLIPAPAAEAIAVACDAANIDLAALAAAAGQAGNLAIPLVKQLTAVVAGADQDAARYVHWGATSQDIIDTGLVLQLRDAMDELQHQLDACGEALASLAQRYRDTPQIGRTWMQHALPVTFGLKAAGWLDGLVRHRRRLRELRPRVLVLQLGGAAGTLASMSGQGTAVAAAMAVQLDLQTPDMPWHGQRDRIAEAATFCGLLTGSLGKIARDISLLAQTEIAELAEPASAGRGGSSTMPHKRNPVACAIALAAATRVPGLVASVLGGMANENERALGGWQAEWDALPSIFSLSAASLQQMTGVLAGLQVDAGRMRANIDLTNGLIMAEAVTLALGPELGKLAAHHLVEQACRTAVEQNRPLREVLAADGQVSKLLDGAALDRLFDPVNYLGHAGEFVDAVLRSWHETA
ncbi:3-carboxy-cis,cis-muconate cycloisomerase [Lacisediminimonas profundi]|uniref:3-carboxy-cis,cis-muconate cycloisomerase n=1 Tax=Lacisediminimonas profundi TaxID=2603856 RepID=UPI00124B5247|nr:3-carboxy-cis,cis-muconate cycloisomerase [Lacisediminimonas profundi]